MNSSGNGNNLSGFNALPSGFLNTAGVFLNKGKTMYWASNDLPDFDKEYAKRRLFIQIQIIFAADF